MGYKNRGYNTKDEKADRNTRDYSLFAIACEGMKREPEYFRPFNAIDRIKVDIIKDEESDQNSSPKAVLEKVKTYIQDVGLSLQDGDTLWIVVDIDRWEREQLDELNDYCKSNPNCNVVVSNPCFEIWLLFHKKKDLEAIDCATPEKAKQTLHTIEIGGYCYLNYIPLLSDAIKNAKENDTNPTHYYPNLKETKMYQLGEALLKCIGIPRFNKFVENDIAALRPKKPSKKKTK